VRRWAAPRALLKALRSVAGSSRSCRFPGSVRFSAWLPLSLRGRLLWPLPWRLPWRPLPFRLRPPHRGVGPLKPPC
jgi:hypothetical protein